MTSIRVITPPDPIVKPSEISSSYSDDDTQIKALIAAATEEIDGPTGWVGRCFGPQTLELSGWFGSCRVHLPCPPIIKIESIVTVDRAGNETAVEAASFWTDGDDIVIAPGSAWVKCDQHRIRYTAGYNGTSGAAPGEIQTGSVPERARQAVIMAVQHMKSLNADNLFLRSEEVEGVGTFQYTVSDAAGAIIRDTSRRLLAGLKVQRV
jgi:hypothetical protein